MERVAGVDGCRGRWVGAACDGSGVEWRALPLAFGEMLDALHDGAGSGPGAACAWTARRVLDGNAVTYGTEPLVIRA